MVQNAEADRFAGPFGFACQYDVVLGDRDDFELALCLAFGLSGCR